MTTQEDILAAMEKEKHKVLSSTVAPPPPITAADIVQDMQDQANPGRGGQKIGANRNIGAPKPPVSATSVTQKEVENFFNIPGLKQMLKNQRR
jgi:hypothetical protein|tara:strand:+ start:238 stop:516 length:279 start_codon:yes stop_codon:yes gene_type:complete